MAGQTDAQAPLLARPGTLKPKSEKLNFMFSSK